MTLIGMGLFPATPKQPKLVFTFALLDLFEALLLECQVSAQDFVAAIGVLSDAHIVDKISNTGEIGTVLMAFTGCVSAWYRYMKYTHR